MKLFSTLFAAILAFGTAGPAARAQLKEAPSDKPSSTVKSVIRKDGETPHTCRVNIAWQVNRIPADHEIEMQYQFRIHTKAGDYGEILATKEFPMGIAYGAARGKSDKNGEWSQAKEYIIDASTFEKNTNMPKSTFNLVIRFEPQVFDKTASRHLTDAKSPAAFLVVDTDEKGRVRKILPIADWFRDQFDNSKSASHAVATIASLDCEDPNQHKLILLTWAEMLMKDKIDTESLEILIRALPKHEINVDSEIDTFKILQELAKHEEVRIREAAKAKLQETAPVKK